MSLTDRFIKKAVDTPRRYAVVQIDRAARQAREIIAAVHQHAYGVLALDKTYEGDYHDSGVDSFTKSIKFNYDEAGLELTACAKVPEQIMRVKAHEDGTITIKRLPTLYGVGKPELNEQTISAADTKALHDAFAKGIMALYHPVIIHYMADLLEATQKSSSLDENVSEEDVDASMSLVTERVSHTVLDSLIELSKANPDHEALSSMGQIAVEIDDLSSLLEAGMLAHDDYEVSTKHMKRVFKKDGTLYRNHGNFDDATASVNDKKKFKFFDLQLEKNGITLHRTVFSVNVKERANQDGAEEGKPKSLDSVRGQFKKTSSFHSSHQQYFPSLELSASEHNSITVKMGDKNLSCMAYEVDELRDYLASYVQRCVPDIVMMDIQEDRGAKDDALKEGLQISGKHEGKSDRAAPSVLETPASQSGSDFTAKLISSDDFAQSAGGVDINRIMPIEQAVEQPLQAVQTAEPPKRSFLSGILKR